MAAGIWLEIHAREALFGQTKDNSLKEANDLVWKLLKIGCKTWEEYAGYLI